MFEIIVDEFCSQLSNYQCHVKFEDLYFPILKGEPSEAQKIIFGNYAVLDEKGLEVLKQIRDKSSEIYTGEDLNNFYIFWTKSFKKFPISLLGFLAPKLKEKCEFGRKILLSA